MKKKVFWTVNLLLLCAMVLCYARWIEPRWIQVKKVELSLPGLTEEMRVVCFGDTHMGLEFGPEDLENGWKKSTGRSPRPWCSWGICLTITANMRATREK